jgi:peptide/nickel transport system permease protein
MTAPAIARSSSFRRIVGFGGSQAGIALALLLLMALVGIAAPLIAPHDPESISSSHVMGEPSLANPFGLDALGRDVLSRVIFAFRTSLTVAIGSVSLALAIGIPIGLTAAFFGGWVDNLLMRPLDLLLALPAMLLAVALIAIVGPGTLVVLLAIALLYVPILARVMRSSVLTVKTEPYVDGARARGVGDLTILLRHVLPNALGPSLVQASVLMAFALQIEAALSFLGLGVQPPTPSLGRMIAEGRDVLVQAPWVSIFPGLAIVMAVLAFNLLGDGMRHRIEAEGR